MSRSRLDSRTGREAEKPRRNHAPWNVGRAATRKSNGIMRSLRQQPLLIIYVDAPRVVSANAANCPRLLTVAPSETIVSRCVARAAQPVNRTLARFCPRILSFPSADGTPTLQFYLQHNNLSDGLSLFFLAIRRCGRTRQNNAHVRFSARRICYEKEPPVQISSCATYVCALIEFLDLARAKTAWAY